MTENAYVVDVDTRRFLLLGGASMTFGEMRSATSTSSGEKVSRCTSVSTSKLDLPCLEEQLSSAVKSPCGAPWEPTDVYCIFICVVPSSGCHVGEVRLGGREIWGQPNPKHKQTQQFSKYVPLFREICRCPFLEGACGLCICIFVFAFSWIVFVMVLTCVGENGHSTEYNG
jgi:hypothetical protein